MTTIETAAIDAIRSGRLVNCTAEEYPRVRHALHDFAGRCIDYDSADIRARIALEEIRRLDRKFDF